MMKVQILKTKRYSAVFLSIVILQPRQPICVWPALASFRIETETLAARTTTSHKTTTFQQFICH